MSGGFGGGVLSLTEAGGDPFGGTGSSPVNRSKGIRCWAAGCRLSEAWGSLLRKTGGPQSFIYEQGEERGRRYVSCRVLVFPTARSCREASGLATTQEFPPVSLFCQFINVKAHHSAGIRIAGSGLTRSSSLEENSSDDAADRQTNQE